MKKLLYIMKRIIFSIILLYTYNLIGISINLIIPINIVTILIVSLFDIPGFLLLLLILKIYY